MATHPQTNPRVAFRMKPELKARIEEAAAFLGLTTTDFVTSTLAERAAEVVDRRRGIVLSDRDRDRFLAALERPGRPVPALAAMMTQQRTGGRE